MKELGLIDMHTHTCYSDGDLTPNALVRKAEKEGIDTIAITDHDTLLGVQNMTIPKNKCNKWNRSFYKSPSRKNAYLGA